MHDGRAVRLPALGRRTYVWTCGRTGQWRLHSMPGLTAEVVDALPWTPSPCRVWNADQVTKAVADRLAAEIEKETSQ